MRSIAWRVLVVLSIILPGIARAHNAPPRESAAADQAENVPVQDPIPPEVLMFSVVKVTNSLAEVFSANRSGGHGTGFFVGIDPETGKGLIFTNRHVIESSSTQAQEIKLEFNTPQTRGETVTAKL